MLNIIPFFEKNSYATAGTNITKTSTADFDQGTNTNTNTTSDEMKMMPNPRTAWYQTGGTWNYRKKIIIDHTKVPNTDQTDFPVLINLASDSDLASKAQDDGDDILLTQEDQTTKLSHEIESFDGTTGALVLWVKIPLLSHTYDTTVYMYYGNASATNQQNVADVWSNGYAGVWHLGDNAANTNVSDSTGLDNGVAQANTSSKSVTGKNGKALTFNGTSDYIDLGNPANMQFANGTSFTMSYWAYISGNNLVAISHQNTAYTDYFYAGNIYLCKSGVACTSGAPITAGQWGHVVIVNNVGSNAQIYVDGVLKINQSFTQTYSYAANLRIGYTAADDLKFNGLLDDTRISSTARSADWIATEYANQNAPASFYSLQSETAKTSVNIAGNNISTDWYQPSTGSGQAWLYRRQIVIDHTKVPNTDQSEFPMLVKIADTTDPIFTKAQADGDDILFTNAYGSTKLSHEIETFNTTTKELWAWVKIPTLKTATDTTIWLYYGNASAISQQNATDVWSNGYKNVWHLNNATATTVSDSTASAITGNKLSASEPTESDGKIAKGQTYGVANNKIAFSGLTAIGTSAFTISVWFNPITLSGGNHVLIGYPLDWSTLAIDSSQKLNFYSAGFKFTAPTAVTTGNWYEATLVGNGGADGSRNIKLYQGGVQISDTFTSNYNFTPTNFNLGIHSNNSSEPFNGIIDETRLASTARSADWIATEYANQNAPETFASISKESGYYPAAGTAGWYATGGTWTARQAVTIDKTKVPNTNQTDFPVLIKITNQSNGVFAGAQADGDDILFTSSDGKTKLSHEIETYTTTAGSKALWAWVKVPTLSTFTDTVLYMYYGNAATTSQQNKTDVWSNGYAGVWHMNEVSGTIYDSTSNNNDSSSQALTYGVAGKTGGAGSFDGINNKATIPLTNSLKIATNITVESWVKPSGTGDRGLLGAWSNMSWNFDLYNGKALLQAGTGVPYVQSNTTIASDQWWHLVGVYDGSNLRIYVNGASDAVPVSASGSIPYGAATEMWLGTYTGSNSYYNGVLDNARISNVVRSADWIATEYNNQNSPETFESFGMEQSNVAYASPTFTTAGSGIIDTTWNGGWGTNGFSSAVTVPTNTSINFQMRSSAVGGSTDGDWTAWADLGTATITGTFAVTAANMPAGITTGTNRYIQTRAVLASSDGSATPTLSDYTVSYLADTTAPTNPSTTALTIAGSAQTTSTWTNTSGAVVATFSGSSDGAGSESGLAGYYVYFGTDYSADPLTAGVYQAHSGAVGDNQTYSSSISTSDDGKYYFLRVKTKDIAGNISSAATTFDFGYDISVPTRPTFISANPAGYTTNNSFSFTWPAGADVKTAGGWYSSSWSSRQQVTFDHTKVPNTDQSDFPVLVKITDANNELFTSAKTNGYDILFTSTNGTTKLSHEIEKYDSTTKELWAWVKLPLLSHETDTKIYMYYGNAAATNQQNATDVWSNGYAGVWHMGEASGTIYDSTAIYNSTSVTNMGFGTSGKIGNSISFSDGFGRFNTSHISQLDNTNKFTLSQWVNLSSLSNTRGMRFFNQANSYSGLNLFIYPGSGDLYMFIGSNTDNYAFGTYSYPSNLLNNWVRFDWVYDGTQTGNVNRLKIFLNGEQKTMGDFVAIPSYAGANSSNGNFGAQDYFGESTSPRGRFDNFNISTGSRSADWIATEYANQNSPETFMSVSASNGGSDIKWYEYKRATDGAWSHTADASTRTVSGLTAYQEGANAFYVRSVDNAGNVSSNYQQVTYYYSGVAPDKPTGLEVSPDTSDSNSFTIHWHKPAVDPEDPPVVGYYYSINATPTIANVTYKASTSDITTIGPDAFATLQGVNTIYVVSVNAVGNLSYETAYVASTTFTCVTPAPAIPVSVSLYDSSDRTLDRWMLTTQWVAGSTPGAGAVDHYNIERSTNGTDFTHLANSTSTAYIDTSGLNNSTNYSYRIKAVDNSGRESAPSSIVSKMPTGKYLTPPAIISQPAVTKIKSNEATISWTTDRASTSVIRYAGASSPQAPPLSGVALTLSTGNFDLVTNHTVTVLGLNPSTKYYFEVQSMDEDRDYDPETAYSTTYNFNTLDAPAISDVTIENINLTTADISFKTTTVANSSINYGTSTTYNNSIEDKSGEGTTSHKVKLTELASGTLHHFKIQGTDIDGNKLTSDDYSFKTLEPPKAENIKATPIEGEPTYTTKITWSSNVETTTVLKYTPRNGPARSASSTADAGGDTKESASSKLSTNHEVIIKDLQDNTTYTIQATGRDQFGNEATVSSLTIETPKDSRPPKIDSLNVESNINGSNADSKSQIVISWHTDEPSTSQVEYGEGTGAEGYGSSSQEYTNLASDHLVILSDLDNQKPYHIRAVSKDASGNAAYSENTVVVTKKPRQAAFTLIMDTLAKSLGFLGRIFNF